MTDGRKQESEHTLDFEQQFTSTELKLAPASRKRKMANTSVMEQPKHRASRNEVKSDPIQPRKTSRRGLEKCELNVGNTHTLVTNGKKPHKWTMFVRGPDPTVRDASKLGVEKVIFHLHPDYSPSEVTVHKSPFEVSRYGWGTFDVKVEIHMTDGRKEDVDHTLTFEEGNVFNLITISEYKQ